MVWQRKEKDGLQFLTYEGWEGVSCFVSTRRGGVSPSPYESLNLGMSSGDRKENGEENRKRFYGALGIDPSKVIIPGQVHGKEIRIVNSELRMENSEFKNHHSPFSVPFQCDGLLTRSPGLVLGVTIADCLAIFLFDSRNKVIGLLHAGWRGIIQGIGEEAMRKMKQEYGTVQRDCEVLLSPAIGPCCYEVKEDVVESFRNVGAIHAPTKELPLKERNGKVFLDLGKAVEIQFLKEGVTKIFPSGKDQICTSCHEKDFFSYRRERGETGRMLAVIWKIM